VTADTPTVPGHDITPTPAPETYPGDTWWLCSCGDRLITPESVSRHLEQARELAEWAATLPTMTLADLLDDYAKQSHTRVQLGPKGTYRSRTRDQTRANLLRSELENRYAAGGGVTNAVATPADLDAIAARIGDPGSFTPRADGESITRWSARAVLDLLPASPSGETTPPGGPCAMLPWVGSTTQGGEVEAYGIDDHVVLVVNPVGHVGSCVHLSPDVADDMADGLRASAARARREVAAASVQPGTDVQATPTQVDDQAEADR